MSTNPAVETATGPVTLDQLGRTLMHEHVFVLDPEMISNYDTGWDEEREVARAIDRLNELKAAGIDTIVDHTVVGIGRDIPRIQRIAAAVAVNILVATGIYVFDHLPSYFGLRGAGRGPDEPDLLTEMFIGDIRDGIKDTGVKAAFLKCATDVPGMTPDVERVIRAVAAAQLETGVPISTHTNAASRRGLEQQRVLADAGVDLSRVVIGHCGDTDDLDYLEEILRNGSYLGLDRFGADVFLPVEDRIRVVVELCERGHSSRILLSHDYASYNDWMEPEWIRATHPRWNYLLIPTQVVPELLRRGLDESTIQTMLVDNPRAVFSRSSAIA